MLSRVAWGTLNVPQHFQNSLLRHQSLARCPPTSVVAVSFSEMISSFTSLEIGAVGSVVAHTLVMSIQCNLAGLSVPAPLGVTMSPDLGQVFLQQSTTRSLLYFCDHWRGTWTVWTERLLLPPPSHAYLLVFLCFLFFCLFCELWVFSQPAKLNPLDFCDECAVVYCCVRTWSSQRKLQAYLCNETYELCLRALSTWNIAWQHPGKTSQKSDVATAGCRPVICQHFRGPAVHALVEKSPRVFVCFCGEEKKGRRAARSSNSLFVLYSFVCLSLEVNLDH